MVHGQHGRLTLLSAFSGLGGLDLGLEAAGFEHIGCIERDENARCSLKLNRGERWPLLEPGDLSTLVSTLKPEQLGIERRELALLAGGPPCQPFSKAAQWSASARQGLEDARARSLHDFLRLIEIFLPRVILIENVSGFVRGTVSALGVIHVVLDEINRCWGTSYRADHRLLDSADFGVAQHRLRAVVVITRDGDRFSWPRPTHKGNPTRAWDAIGNLSRDQRKPEAVGKWSSLLPSIPEGANYLWHTSRGGGRPLFGYRTRFWSFLLKLAKDQPSWTLPAQPGPSTGPFHWDNRPLTIREMLRLQSFAADWFVDGSYREQVRQVGNATPPLLAEVIGRAVADQLFDTPSTSSPLCYQIAHARTVPPPAPVTAVPAEFRSLEGDHPDHPGVGKGPKPRLGRLSTP